MKERSTQSADRITRDLLLVIFLAVLVSIPFLGTRPFATRGEPREALVAQAMLSQGDWLLGNGYGGGVPAKPPMLHWIICSLSTLTGDVSEWTARLPSALASIGFAAVWFLFLRKRVRGDVAALSTFLTITSTEWYRSATSCRVDTVFCVSFVLSLLGLFRWWERGLKGFPLLTIIAIAAATLAKGPVSLCLPAMFFVIFLYLRGERFLKIVTACCTAFIPAFLAAGTWYVFAYVQRGQEFVDMVYYENIARASSTQVDAPHTHSAFYLYMTLVSGFLPFTIVLLRLIPIVPQWLISLPTRWKTRVNRAPELRMSAFAQFSIISAIGFILLFSIPQGKRSVYLLPAYPFISYGLAHALLQYDVFSKQFTRRALQIFSCALFVFGFLLTAAPSLVLSSCNLVYGAKGCPVIISPILALGREPGFEEVWWLLLLAICLYASFGSAWFYKGFRQIAVYFALIYLTIAGSCFQYFAELTTPREFADSLRAQLDPNFPLYSYANEFYGMSFYLHRELKTIPGNWPNRSYIFTYQEDSAALEKLILPTQALALIARSPRYIDRLGSYLELYRIDEKATPNSMLAETVAAAMPRIGSAVIK